MTVLLLFVNVVHLVALALRVKVNHLGDDPVVVRVVARSGEGCNKVAHLGDVVGLGRNGAAQGRGTLVD